jgi:hypothetical protein
VGEHDRQDHGEGMLDGEEAQSRIAHGGGEVLECLFGKRAQEEIQQQAKQELEIHGRGEVHTPFTISLRPILFPKPAQESKDSNHNAQDKSHPADDVVHIQKELIHSCYKASI